MSVVVDASVIVAALVDSGPDGAWAEAIVAAGGLLAPHLMPVEVAAILRRAEHAGQITRDVASLAHADLADLQTQLVAYEPFARRVWELRANVTPYDAWYVAIAEAARLPLATLDRRLTRASGPRCTFMTPGS